mgnify:FL=1
MRDNDTGNGKNPNSYRVQWDALEQLIMLNLCVYIHYGYVFWFHFPDSDMPIMFYNLHTRLIHTLWIWIEMHGDMRAYIWMDETQEKDLQVTTILKIIKLYYSNT